MICESCHGEGYVRGIDPEYEGALVLLPCLDCMGSGISSCCDVGGSYSDPSYPERACDYCGKLYRGRAVYCSLECATDDL